MLNASPPPSADSTPQQVCGFLVDDVCFAVDVAGLAEVLRGGRLTVVPLAPPAVVGLLHLRGRIVPVIDTRLCLGFPAAGLAAKPRTHLVLRLQEDWYSLLVDEILDVFEIPAGRIEHPTKPAAVLEAVSGVYAGKDRLVHLLDPQRIVQGLGRHRVRSRSGD